MFTFKQRLVLAIAGVLGLISLGFTFFVGYHYYIMAASDQRMKEWHAAHPGAFINGGVVGWTARLHHVALIYGCALGFTILCAVAIVGMFAWAFTRRYL